MIRNLLHNLTHRHMTATQEGVGQIAFCGWRTSRKVRRFAFRPDFDGATWWLIDCHTAHSILSCGSAHEAMALVRKAAAS